MKTTITLRHRLLLLTLLPSALIAMTLVAYFTYSGIRTLEAELHAKGMSTVRYLAPVSEYGIIAGQIEGLHGLAQAAVQESGVKAAIIVSPRGRTLAVSGRVSLSAETLRQPLTGHGLVAETDQWVAFGAPVRRSLNESDLLFDPSSNPDSGPEIIGRVYVEFDKTALAAQQRQLLMRGLTIMLFGMLMLAGLAIAMADTLVRPVMRLAQAVREMSSGHLETRVPEVSSGELGTLEQGFNEMAEHIQNAHRSMQARIEEATAQLAHQARHDALTGLLNRREFEHRLEKSLAAVQAGGNEFSLLFVDLDRFKVVNDNCGYLAGDELLKQMALLFQGRLREDDTLARLGGDEFAILLNNCGRTRARQVADDICELVGAYRFIWQDKVFPIGASIGLTTVDRKVRNIGEIIAAADAACHLAKESGRNHVREQEAASEDRRRDGGNWASRIAAALSEDRLMIEAVPMLALQEGAPQDHLVTLTARLNEPGQPPVSLPALMDVAERYDLAPDIDRRLIDAAIEALVRARRQRRTLHCLVPLSAASLRGRSTLEHVQRTLPGRWLGDNRLCFVLAEDVMTQFTSQAMEFAREIAKLGGEIGLDDFGGGLSSFSHLRSVQPTFIKLSRSLTRELEGNRATTALLRAIQEIAGDQNIHTIAEGVDEPEQVDRLKELGIDYAEGKCAGVQEPFDAWLEGAVMRVG